MAVKSGKYLFPLIAAYLFLGTSVRAQEVVAVLSSELRPYLEAYDGFKETLASPVAVVSLSAGEPRIGRKTRVVVAFGSKAAMQTYPDEVVLVYCMAPGAAPRRDHNQGPFVHVNMLPEPGTLVAALGQIQPQMKRLAVLWALDSFAAYVAKMEEATAKLEIVGEQLREADELPERLRQLVGKEVDALWLPPDPLLINAQNFAMLREFSWANDVPLYAPTAGFVAEGAVASIAISFVQVGREAAAIVQAILEDGAIPQEVYPGNSEITLNLEAAASAGLRIPEEVTRRAGKVLP